MNDKKSSIKDFQILKKIGQGSFSTVFQVKKISNNQEYAMKKIQMQNLNQKEKSNSLNEIRILASIQHENIVAYKDAFFDPVFFFF